jgi:hypothetical protein
VAREASRFGNSFGHGFARSRQMTDHYSVETAGKMLLSLDALPMDF